MDARTPHNLPPPELLQALHEGRPCDYCPPATKRRATRAIVATDQLGPGREVREIRFICTKCEIMSLDRALGREALVLNTTEGDLVEVVAQLRTRIEQLEAEVDKKRAKKAKGGGA